MTSLITYDAVCNLKTELTCGWCMCAGGCAVTTEFVWEEKSVGFGREKQERVFITPINEAIIPFALHGDTYWHEVTIKLDVRTWTTLSRHNQVVKEVTRILKNTIRKNDDNFTDLILLSSESLTPEYRNIFRHVITLKYRSAESHTFS